MPLEGQRFVPGSSDKLISLPVAVQQATPPEGDVSLQRQKLFSPKQVSKPLLDFSSPEMYARKTQA